MNDQLLKSKKSVLPFLKLDGDSSIKCPSTGVDASTFRMGVMEKVSNTKPIFTDAEIELMLDGAGEYRDELVQAIEVLYLGQLRTAVFLVGRTLETVTRKRFQKRRIPGLKRKGDKGKDKMKWDVILNQLLAKGLIDKSTHDRMSMVKSDRNVGGHPAAPEAVDQLEAYSRQTIETGVKLIKDMSSGKIL